MTWETWTFFVITEAVLSLTPGPAVLLVLAQALSRGAAKSVRSSCGILAANGMYFALSATSLGAILLASYNLFFAVKWVGAAYLVYLGLKTFFANEPALAAREAAGDGHLFRNGFILQASNPKALVFFSALLPQFLNPRYPIAPQVMILGVSSIVVEFFILLGYGMLAGQAAQLARQPRFATMTNRVAGSLLVGAGAGLAALRRT
ncbi:MAG: LysE family transporter [Acidobacteria bacterium]|nr:LysE family transporter [Acidobacteriota bacterium]